MRKPEFVYATYIETTPERLWEAAQAIHPSAPAIEGFNGP